MNALDVPARAASPLTESRLQVDLVDLHAECCLVHRFSNPGERAIEAVFSFPLPLDAAFLSLRATLAGKTLEAAIQPAAAAERVYAEALDEGDSAVLLTQPEPGVLCLSLGNLMPGESGEVQLRFAVWLRVAGGEARFSLPLVHRPRYGRWRLQAIETPSSDLAVEYPLSARFRIGGLLAGGAVRCSSHAARFQQQAGLTEVELQAAHLDGDVVLSIALPRLETPVVRLIEDGGRFLAWVATGIPETAAPPAPLDLCLVMDCSGSMAGDAIRQSRAALSRLAQVLDARDRLQVLRFGSDTVPCFRRMLAVGPDVCAALGELASVLDANLGGTEMATALGSALDALHGSDGSRRRAIILVTDGAVQPGDVRRACARARHEGVGLFVVAVGSAAGVEVLTPLAESTHAAIERAVPAEPIDDSVLRQVARARHGRSQPLPLEWLSGPITPITLPAGFPGEMAAAAARLPADHSSLRWRLAGTETAFALPAATPNTALRALLGQRRYLCASADEREALALDYGLLTEFTSAVLVATREAKGDDKALPEVIKLPQMRPRGSLVDSAPLFSRRQGGVCSPASGPYMAASYCDRSQFLGRAEPSADRVDPAAAASARLSPAIIEALLPRLHAFLTAWLAAHGSLVGDGETWEAALAARFPEPVDRRFIEHCLPWDNAERVALYLALHGVLALSPLDDAAEARLAASALRAEDLDGEAPRALDDMVADCRRQLGDWLAQGFP